MAIKTEGECPMAVAIFIRKQAEKNEISIRQMIKKVAQESDTPEDTIASWVWPRRKKSAVENYSTPNPTKKHTKPEVKLQLEVIAAEIKKGVVSDNDIKTLDNAVASAITTGKANPRVGSSIATAIYKKRRPKGGAKKKEINNFKVLNDSLKKGIEGLTYLADGTIKPVSREDKELLIAILAKAANFIIQFARLGADIEGLYKTFIGGKLNAKSERIKPRLIN